MAYKAFRILDNVKIRHIWILFASGVAYYLFAQKLMTENIDDMNLFFYGGIAWLALYCSVLLFYRRDLISKGAMILLIVVLVTAESVSAVCSAFDTIGNTQRDTYYENYDDITGLVESRSDEFARMEINGNYTELPGILSLQRSVPVFVIGECRYDSADGGDRTGR